MHFQFSSAICFNLDQSTILSSGNGLMIALKTCQCDTDKLHASSLETFHFQERCFGCVIQKKKKNEDNENSKST